MKTAWRKVWGDLRESPARSVLVGLAIFIGITALAAVLTTRTILLREIETSFQNSKPAAIVFLLDAVSPETVEKARSQPGVVEADARKLVRTRVEVEPGDWRTMLIFAVRDFRDLQVSVFQPTSGDFPPLDGELLIERSSLSVLKTKQGEKLHIRAPGGTIRDLAVGGIVHDTGLAPGWQDNSGYAYASPATIESLGHSLQLDELRLTVAENESRESTTQIADSLSKWLVSEGHEIQRIEIPLLRHPHADQMNVLLMLLLIFSVLALVLSGVLTANLMAAMMAKQTRQVGVMKAVGASVWQVTRIYASGILIVSVAAVALGIPLGTIAGRACAEFSAQQLNLAITSSAVPVWLFGIIAILGVGVPLFSALVPIWRTAQKPTLKALQDAGIQPPNKPNHLGKLFDFLTADRRLILALRNTFRRPLRMWLSLGALALGGAMLLTGVNVYSSLVQAVDEGLNRRGDNLDVRLLRPAPNRTEIIGQINNIENVKTVEAWGNALVSFGLSENSASVIGTNRYSLLAPPDDSKMTNFKIVEGRLIEPTETGVIIVNRILHDTEKGLSVGTELNLVFGGDEFPVRVVGVTEEISEPAIYTNSKTLAAVTKLPPQSVGAFRLLTENGTESKVAAALEQVLADNNLIPAFQMTRDVLRQSMIDHFLILLFVLTALALSALIVGGFGLATTMSLNVLERRREIGIIRATGATPQAVLRIILIEGLTIAVLSVLLAIFVSLPLSALVGLVVGKYGLHAALPFAVSFLAIISWMVLAIIIALTSCLFPALDSIKLSVRDVLAYE